MTQSTYSPYTQEDMDALYGARPATTNAQTPVCPAGYAPYALQAGDTLRALAEARGITLNELLFYNPHINPYGYKKGDVLCLPDADAAVATLAEAAAQDAADSGAVTGSGPAAGTGTATGNDTAAAADTSAGNDTAAEGPGPEPLPTPTLTAESDQTPAAPGPGPVPLPTPALPSDSDQTPAAPGPGPIPLPTPTLPTAPTRPSTPTQPGSSTQPGSPVCESGTLYTVRPGDTLRRIAQNFGVTLEALMAANPGSTNSRLVIGQRLCIPDCAMNGSCTPCDACEACGTCGTCAEGTTAVRLRTANFADVCIDYNVSYAALQAANPQTDLSALRAGGTLCIPAPGSRGSCSGGSGTQELASDTTAAMLAAQLNTSVAALLRYNPTFTPMDFRKGRLICVPPKG